MLGLWRIAIRPHSAHTLPAVCSLSVHTLLTPYYPPTIPLLLFMAIIKNGQIDKGSAHTFLGGMTFYMRNGQQIMRPRKNPTHHDRRSFAQMLVRYRNANLTAVGKQLKNILSSDWENMEPRQNYSNCFCKVNFSLPVLACPKPLREQNAAVLDTYQVSQGLLTPIEVDTDLRGSELGVSDILLGQLVVTPETPLAVLSYAIMHSNGDRFQPGDTISFICVYQRLINDVPSVEAHRCNLFLTTAQDGRVSDLYLPGFGSYSPSTVPNGTPSFTQNRLALSAPLPDAGYCWMLTRPVSRTLRHQVSTQSLVLSSTHIRDRFAAPEHILGAALQDGITISDHERNAFLTSTASSQV